MLIDAGAPIYNVCARNALNSTQKQPFDICRETLLRYKYD